MSALRSMCTAVAALLIYFAVVAVIQAQERATDRETWCRQPKAGERLIAWGSADGTATCHYHVNYSYGSVPRKVKQ